jgi:hypothetical protein
MATTQTPTLQPRREGFGGLSLASYAVAATHLRMQALRCSDASVQLSELDPFVGTVEKLLLVFGRPLR